MNPMDLDTDLLNLLPPWYRQILDYQQICSTEQQQLEILAMEITAVARNMFFSTMGVTAIEEWEKIFKIYPSPSDTLEFRRARILNRISTKPPFTLGFLYQKLDELIGPNRWTVRVDYPNYTLYIESAAENQNYATEIAVLLNTIKPAHIVYVNTPYLSDGVLMAEAITGGVYRHNYRLGAWGLGTLPFAGIEREEVFKMPSVPSINMELLQQVANFVSGDVVAARINRSITITALNKIVTGTTLEITYEVNTGQAAEVTYIELLDTNDNVLTECGVYVPITGLTTFKHSIPIERGLNNG